MRNGCGPDLRYCQAAVKSTLFREYDPNMNQPHSLAESLAAIGEVGAIALRKLGLPKELLEKMWEPDSGHLHAADPSRYPPDPAVRKRRVEGSRTILSIYRPAAA